MMLSEMVCKIVFATIPKDLEESASNTSTQTIITNVPCLTIFEMDGGMYKGVGRIVVSFHLGS